MLLVLDMGNTNITLGVYEGDRLLLQSRIATDRIKTSDQYGADIKNMLNLFESSILLKSFI